MVLELQHVCILEYVLDFLPVEGFKFCKFLQLDLSCENSKFSANIFFVFEMLKYPSSSTASTSAFQDFYWHIKDSLTPLIRTSNPIQTSERGRSLGRRPHLCNLLQESGGWHVGQLWRVQLLPVRQWEASGTIGGEAERNWLDGGGRCCCKGMTQTNRPTIPLPPKCVVLFCLPCWLAIRPW